eukprot:TRINITY_DN26_c0_g3_i1.p1 TRINITY_DN26_c0_g3~~TRINITY_DN26_c0_g3_i1.p1  ORF type:complete len:238 (-),score=59.77 TRINITY_DN26_c0_g3_i1:76-789(-)
MKSAISAVAVAVLLSGASAWNSWSPAGAADKRSPCPALNTLANHGYINHNGTQIARNDLVNALTGVYQISSGLAGTLADSAIAGIGYSDASGTKYLDLDALDKHNFIEHDASLTREDIGDNGDNHSPQQYLIDQLKSLSSDGQTLSWAEMAKARTLRPSQEQASDGSYGLDVVHATAAYTEAAFVLRVLGTGTSIPLTFVDSFFGSEKIPDGWSPSTPGYGAVQAAADAAYIKSLTL